MRDVLDAVAVVALKLPIISSQGFGRPLKLLNYKDDIKIVSDELYRTKECTTLFASNYMICSVQLSNV